MLEKRRVRKKSTDGTISKRCLENKLERGRNVGIL